MFPEEEGERPPCVEECVAAGDNDRNGAGEVFQLRHGELVRQQFYARKEFLSKLSSRAQSSDPELLPFFKVPQRA
jgi:hypothetical protein